MQNRCSYPTLLCTCKRIYTNIPTESSRFVPDRHWMIRKIEQNGNTGIVFAQDRLATFITDFENQATSENGIHYNRNSSAAIIDRLLDPKRPFVSAAWWLLEIFPFPLRKRNYRQNKWSTTFVCVLLCCWPFKQKLTTPFARTIQSAFRKTKTGISRI